MTSPWDPLVWRIACRITEALMGLARDRPEPTFPGAYWSILSRLLAQQALARGRGWQQAVEHLSHRIEDQLRWLQSDLRRFEEHWHDSLCRPVRVEPREVYAELLALRDEFPNVVFDLQQTTIRVTTLPVVLDEIELGPFTLVWNWSQLPNDWELTVVAEDPCYSRERSDVPHPHVQRDRLCVGEGMPLLEQALAEGRLCDYFLILQQILRTYNDSNAYVPLGSWTGTPCQACGELVCEDELSSCQVCGDRCCGECVGGCDRCRNLTCHSCLIVEDDGVVRCSSCPPSPDELEPDDAVSTPSFAESLEISQDIEPQDTPVKVHPDRLGQVAVPA